jgi:ketosteroid isomerase-like protein
MLAELVAKLQQAFAERDAKMVASFYAEDAVFLVPGRAPTVGRDAIEIEVCADFHDAGFGRVLRVVDEKGSSDLRYVLGSLSTSSSDPVTQADQVATGHFVQIWRRGSRGSWQISCDISCPGGPAL